MALLQISEPGQSSAPHEHRLAVGIDLGTTNSLVATVRSGVATALPANSTAMHPVRSPIRNTFPPHVENRCVPARYEQSVPICEAIDVPTLKE